MNKSKLAILLSKLAVFENPSMYLEQYPTDSENASIILWNAFMGGDIENKTIADFGCGTGILGLGALLLGAKECFFIDKDKKAVQTAEQNLLLLEKETGKELCSKAKFIVSDIKNFSEKVDVVLQNPPFGTKEKGADRIFLDKAIECGKVIYSIHKTSTLDFLRKHISAKAKLTNEYRLSMPLKSTMKFHKKRIERIDAVCLRIEGQ